MPVVHSERRPIQSSEDVVRVRQAVRQRAVELGFSLIDQTKIVTAASELARNTVQYGGGGHVEMETVEEGHRRGLRLVFVDERPGHPRRRARPSRRLQHGQRTRARPRGGAAPFK